MTMSFVDIRNPHNLQDITFNNIQRRKPRLAAKLKELSLLMDVYLEAKYLLKWLALKIKSLSNLFRIITGGIKGIFLL